VLQRNKYWWPKLPDNENRIVIAAVQDNPYAGVCSHHIPCRQQDHTSANASFSDHHVNACDKRGKHGIEAHISGVAHLAHSRSQVASRNSICQSRRSQCFQVCMQTLDEYHIRTFVADTSVDRCSTLTGRGYISRSTLTGQAWTPCSCLHGECSISITKQSDTSIPVSPRSRAASDVVLQQPHLLSQA
jgi:hypothetical protein